MAALPAPAALPAWRKPALAALWAAAGLGIALALPGAVVDVAHEVMRVIVGQRVSLAGIAAGAGRRWARPPGRRAALALRDD